MMFVLQSLKGQVTIVDTTTGSPVCSGGTVVSGGYYGTAFAQLTLPTACGVFHSLHYMRLKSTGAVGSVHWYAVLGKTVPTCGPPNYNTAC